MSKNRGMKQQIIFALSEMRAHGESKRADKGKGESINKIYSTSYWEDLRTFAGKLGGFLKSEFPDTRRVCDVSTLQLQKFLNRDGITDSTREKEVSYVKKIDVAIRRAYGRGFDGNLERMTIRHEDTAKIHDLSASKEMYVDLRTAMNTGKSESYKACDLARFAGLRIEECAKIRVNGRFNFYGGRWGFGTVEVKGKADGAKGGRGRVVDILTADGRDMLADLFSGHSKGTVIQTADGSAMTKDNISQSRRRACKRAGIEWKDGNGLHPLRKLFAQECYDRLRTSGASIKEASDYAMEQLGHGKNREELKRVYIANMW